MARVPFLKLHGLGNDFVVLDARRGSLPVAVDAALARALAHRRTGIGCDQLIVLTPASSPAADLAMRIFNPDGSEAEACGNATRAVAWSIGSARIETIGGILSAAPADEGVTVLFAPPRFAWQAIPLAYAMDTLAMPIGWEMLEGPGAVNLGNPHVVFLVAEETRVPLERIPLERLGPIIEHDPLFPERVNVSVAQVVSRGELAVRVWERGAGLTLACGTGAMASAVVAMRRGVVDRHVRVTLPGGALAIAWREDGTIAMTGPAAESFRGSFDPADYGLAIRAPA